MVQLRHLRRGTGSYRVATRKPYDLLTRYVSNHAVSDPDAPITWRWSSGTGIRTAEAKFGTKRCVTTLEVFLNHTLGTGWGGLVEVTVRRAGARFAEPRPARFIRVQAINSTGWTVLSEIELH